MEQQKRTDLSYILQACAGTALVMFIIALVIFIY
ncbi:MAG: hypothetical protein ACFWT6_12155 [Virgibacillus proomii]|jgi:hypothetical protein